MATVHVLPMADLVEHQDDEDCPCGPSFELVPTRGEDGWIVIHHSLDGREHHEPQEA